MVLNRGVELLTMGGHFSVGELIVKLAYKGRLYIFEIVTGGEKWRVILDYTG